MPLLGAHWPITIPYSFLCCSVLAPCISLGFHFGSYLCPEYQSDVLHCPDVPFSSFLPSSLEPELLEEVGLYLDLEGWVEVTIQFSSKTSILFFCPHNPAPARWAVPLWVKQTLTLSSQWDLMEHLVETLQHTDKGIETQRDKQTRLRSSGSWQQPFECTAFSTLPLWREVYISSLMIMKQTPLILFSTRQSCSNIWLLNILYFSMFAK